MATKRSVRRSLVLPVPPARLWVALSDPDLLARWLGVAVTIEVVPGRVGSAGERTVRIDEVDPARLLTFTWWSADPDDDPPSRVRFEVESLPEGSRLTVEETALADLDDVPGRDAGAAAPDSGGETAAPALATVAAVAPR
jgi:uncharacterized protein YndB with AHSA1/START domain